MGYQIMFFGGLALSIVSLTLAIYFFIKFQIKQVITDLTGFRISKSKQQNHYHYQADLTTTGKQTSSAIVVKKDQATRKTTNSLKETELLSEPEALSESNQSALKETELLSEIDDMTLLAESAEAFVISEDMIVVDSNEVIENGGKKIV